MTKMLQSIVTRTISVPVTVTMDAIARGQSARDARDVQRLKAQLDWRTDPEARGSQRRAPR